MNLNREQFLKAVERGRSLLKELKKDYPELKLSPVFSRFGSRSGQCDLTTDLRKIILDFPEMLIPSEDTTRLHTALQRLMRAEKDENKNAIPELRKQCDALSAELITSRKLLAPELLLYWGDVLIEYRPGELKYESLRRLQQDERLPPGLNTVGNIRVIAGSLLSLITCRSYKMCRMEKNHLVSNTE